MKNLLVFLVVFVGTIQAQAATWYEYWVHEGNARISYTVESMVPTIGLEQGATAAGKLYVEIFKMDYTGKCPQVAISNNSENGSKLLYDVTMKYDSAEKKCWGEVSKDNNIGRILPQQTLTVYYRHKILVLVGQKKQQHTLYVRDISSDREFNFVLADSMK